MTSRTVDIFTSENGDKTVTVEITEPARPFPVLLATARITVSKGNEELADKFINLMKLLAK